LSGYIRVTILELASESPILWAFLVCDFSPKYFFGRIEV